MRFHFFFSAAVTAIDSHQLSLLHIELLFLADHPLVEVMLTHAFTRRFLLRFFERQDIAHTLSPWRKIVTRAYRKCYLVRYSDIPYKENSSPIPSPTSAIRNKVGKPSSRRSTPQDTNLPAAMPSNASAKASNTPSRHCG